MEKLAHPRILKEINFWIMLAVSFGSIPLAISQTLEPIPNPYTVRIGTLEFREESNREYIVFNDGTTIEKYDVSPLAILESSGIRFPGIPDLKEIGFKTKEGQIYKYGDKSKNEFVRQFLIDHPEVKEIEALVYSGFLKEDFVLNIEGLTPVCRVDIKHGTRHVILWKNLPKNEDKR